MKTASRERPLLTATQEVALARRIHGPDPADALAARNELVGRNLGLVGQAANYYHGRYRHRRLDRDDLFSAGCLGLIRAAELYRPWEHRVRFSSYAAHGIYHAIRDHLARDGMVRAPNYIQNPATVRSKLARPEAKPGSRALLLANLAAARAATAGCVSLSAPGMDPEYGDGPDPANQPLDAMIAAEDGGRLLAALGELKPLYAYILIHRWGLCEAPTRKLRELADELGCTRERVRQIEWAAVDALRVILGRGRDSGRKACA